MHFEDQTAAGRVRCHVAYFFFTDGQYENDPIAVRQTLANLRYKHGFYSKIEINTALDDHDQAQAVTRDFLSAALPESEKVHARLEQR